MYCIFEGYVRTLMYCILAYAYRRVAECVAETQFEPWAVRHRRPFMKTVFPVIEARGLY